MMKKIRFTKVSRWKLLLPGKQTDTFKSGDEIELEDAKAEEAVKLGYAEYIEEKAMKPNENKMISSKDIENKGKKAKSRKK
jgi:hypothetical protein